MTQFFERYVVWEPRSDKPILRIDQASVPLPVSPVKEGVHAILSKEEAEEIVPRHQIDEAFSSYRARVSTDAPIHLDVMVTGKPLERLLTRYDR